MCEWACHGSVALKDVRLPGDSRSSTDDHSSPRCWPPPPVAFLWGGGTGKILPPPEFELAPRLTRGQRGWLFLCYTVRPAGVLLLLQHRCINQFQVQTKFCSAMKTKYSSWVVHRGQSLLVLSTIAFLCELP